MGSILGDGLKETDFRNGQCYNGEVVWQISDFCSFYFYLKVVLLATSMSILEGNYHQFLCFHWKLG